MLLASNVSKRFGNEAIMTANYLRNRSPTNAHGEQFVNKTPAKMWVLKLKYKANGEVEKYKARLVARGFTQKKGFDYDETFSPTAKFTTFRVLMSYANHFNLQIHHVDVTSAFLNGEISEDIFMDQP